MTDKYLLLKHMTSSDKFYDMPLSAQALYFHFVINATIGGSVTDAKGLIRAIGATENDLYTLIINGFIDCMHVNGIGVLRVSRWGDSMFDEIKE